MTEGGSAVAISGVGSTACLRKQFELRINDSVFEPSKKPVRPASLRNTKDLFKKSSPEELINQKSPDNVQRKQWKITSPSELIKNFSPASSSLASPSSLLPSTSSEKFALKESEIEEQDCEGSNDANKMEHANKTNRSLSEGSAPKTAPRKTQDTKSPVLMPSASRSVFYVGKKSSSSATNGPSETKNIVSPQSERNALPYGEAVPANNTSPNVTLTKDNMGNHSPNIATAISKVQSTNLTEDTLDINPALTAGSTLDSIPTEVKNLHEETTTTTTTTTNYAETESATQSIVDQRITEPQKTPTHLLGDHAYTPYSMPNKVKQLARSMDNLNLTPAGTPTKEVKSFPSNSSEKKLNSILFSAAASTSLSHSVSVISSTKPAVRAKKPPPPPVPKKNVKVKEAGTTSPDPHQPIMTKTEDSRSVPNSDESRTLPTASQISKYPRPTTLFPQMQMVDGEDSDDKYNSLPLLMGMSRVLSEGDILASNTSENTLLPSDATFSSTSDILASRSSNTLFPCNRQKPRTPMLCRETGKSDDNLFSSSKGVDLSPTSAPTLRWLRSEDTDVLPSPMSLGTQTPPDIDSLAGSRERIADESSCVADVSLTSLMPNPSPSDQLSNICDETLPKPGSSDTDQAALSPEGFDSDNFLSETFEFLDETKFLDVEDEGKVSLLKTWTDTWLNKQPKVDGNATPSASEMNTAGNIHSSATSDHKGSKIEATISSSEFGSSCALRNTESVAKKEQISIKSFDVGSLHRNRSKQESNKMATEQTKLSGAELRRSSSGKGLLSNRSSLVSVVPAETATVPLKDKRPGSLMSRPSSVRKSTNGCAKMEFTPAFLSRKPSTTSISSIASRVSSMPLTILPSERPMPKIPGKYIGGKPSVILNQQAFHVEKGAGASPGSSVPTTGNDLEQDIEVIDRAFDFLDNSGV